MDFAKIHCFSWETFKENYIIIFSVYFDKSIEVILGNTFPVTVYHFLPSGKKHPISKFKWSIDRGTANFQQTNVDHIVSRSFIQMKILCNIAISLLENVICDWKLATLCGRSDGIILSLFIKKYCFAGCE